MLKGLSRAVCLCTVCEGVLHACMQEGDWMDTLQMPVLSPLGNTAVGLRVQPGPFAGYAVTWPASDNCGMTHTPLRSLIARSPPLLALLVV